MNENDFESWVTHSSKAIEADRSDVLRQALKFSAQLNRDLLSAVVSDGNTLLHLACKANRADAVRILLQAGADPCLQNSAGRVPLELCTSEVVRHAFVMDCVQAICRSDHHRLLQHLAAGVAPDCLDSVLTRNSLLHWAANRGTDDCVQALLARGANPNGANADGLTPLHEAVLRGHGTTMAELIRAGADPRQVATAGQHAGRSAATICAELYPELVTCLAVPVDCPPALTSSTPLILRHNSWDGTESVNNHHDRLSLLANSESDSSNDAWPAEAAETSGRWDGVKFLWPPPRSVQTTDGPGVVLVRETALRLVVCGAVQPTESTRADRALELLTAGMEARGVPVRRAQRQTHSLRLPPHMPITLELGQQVAAARPQGYQILVGDGKIRLQSASALGLHYAGLTFLQLLDAADAHSGHLPALKIEDWPSVRDRGVLFDLSAGLLPRPERLLQWAAALSRSKVNQLHLFVRAGPSSELLSGGGIDFRDLRALCEACRGLLVEPVLALDIAATVESLAELPGDAMEQLVACFPADSPLHIGPRLSLFIVQALSEPQGLSLPPWLDLRSRPRVGLCPSSAEDAGRMWSLMALPMVAMEYIVPGYHEWRRKRDLLRRQGVPFCVCLGAASVTSVTGCSARVLPDLLPALPADLDAAASGVLSCQWGGPFPLAQPLFGMPGHLCITGQAWAGPGATPDASAALARIRAVCLAPLVGGMEAADALLDLGLLEAQLLPVDAAPFTSLLSAGASDLRAAAQGVLEHGGSAPRRVFHRSRAWARRLERTDADKDSATALLAHVARLMEFSCRLALLHAPDRPRCSTARTDLANRAIALMEEAKALGERWFSLTDRGRGAVGAAFRALLAQVLPDQALRDLSRSLPDGHVV